MKELYTRTELLVGSENMEKLKNARVFVAGLGGVGGYIAEALARAGVGSLMLCDFDCMDATNLNRQILALQPDIGRKKTELAACRIGQINENCELILIPARIAAEDGPDTIAAASLGLAGCSYIADAIDDVPAKLALIREAKRLNIPVISSMGTGNKLDPFRFRIADISKTHTDPLAKSVRTRLRAEGIEKGVKVLFSDEEPAVKGAKPIPSISYMPPLAGLMIAGEIIRDLIGREG